MKLLSKKRVIVVLCIVIALVIGTMAGFVLMPMLSPFGNQVVATSSSPTTPGDTPQNGESATEPGMMYPMSERVVNLADPGGFRYVKIQIVVEYALPEVKNLKGEAYKKKQDEFIKEMASRRPKMDDILTTVLASKTSISLSLGEGKENLRDELKARLDEVSGDHHVVNIYFTQLIIQ